MNTVLPIYSTPLTDYFGTPINIGNVILIASPKRNCDTSYSEMLVTSRTEKMLRAVKVRGSDVRHPVIQDSLEQTLSHYAWSFKNSPRKLGAVISPWNVVVTDQSILLAPKKIREIMENPKDHGSDLRVSFP